MFSAFPPIATDVPRSRMVCVVPCVDGAPLARGFLIVLGWSVRPCVRPVEAARTAAGHDALREGVPTKTLCRSPSGARSAVPARPRLPRSLHAGVRKVAGQRPGFALLASAMGQSRRGPPQSHISAVNRRGVPTPIGVASI